MIIKLALVSTRLHPTRGMSRVLKNAIRFTVNEHRHTTHTHDDSFARGSDKYLRVIQK